MNHDHTDHRAINDSNAHTDGSTPNPVANRDTHTVAQRDADTVGDSNAGAGSNADSSA